MATLAYIAGKYTFLLFEWDSAAHSLLAVSIVAAIWIAVMTWICYVGIELSAATQRILLSVEVFTLAAFAIVALVKVYSGGAPAESLHIGLDWFSPSVCPVAAAH
jgi:amino acid transporter